MAEEHVGPAGDPVRDVPPDLSMRSVGAATLALELNLFDPAGVSVTASGRVVGWLDFPTRADFAAQAGAREGRWTFRPDARRWHFVAVGGDGEPVARLRPRRVGHGGEVTLGDGPARFTLRFRTWSQTWEVAGPEGRRLATIATPKTEAAWTIGLTAEAGRVDRLGLLVLFSSYVTLVDRQFDGGWGGAAGPYG